MLHSPAPFPFLRRGPAVEERLPPKQEVEGANPTGGFFLYMYMQKLQSVCDDVKLLGTFLLASIFNARAQLPTPTTTAA